MLRLMGDWKLSRAASGPPCAIRSPVESRQSPQPMINFDNARENELQQRNRLWSTLLREGGPKGVSPHRLRELGIYRGAQGIWVDKRRTSMLAPDGK
jgi:hypothetical protein